MIQKMRRQFITVTMILISAVFILLLGVYHIHMDYWEKQETIDLLYWISQSDTLMDAADPRIGGKDSEWNTIYTAAVDKEGNIISFKSSDGKGKPDGVEEIIQGIISSGEKSSRWRQWLYVIKEKNDGRYLVFTSCGISLWGVRQLAGSFLLLTAGLFILFILICYLSRFVIKPAEDMLEREKQFVSDASHELKTPVAAIRINAQILDSEEVNERLVHNILSETDRLTSLIKELLTFSYLEEKGSDIQKKKFSLSETCEEIVLSMESIAYEMGIRYDYEIIPDLEYLGNEEELKKMMTILLDNAIRHTDSGGQIMASLQKKGSRPVFIVYNTGEGISDKDLPHIFERFYRAQKDRGRESGNFGLGLSIAKTIVEAHGGEITARSRPGEYAEFEVKL